MAQFDVYRLHDLGEHFFVENGSSDMAFSWLMSSGRTENIRVRNNETGDVWEAYEWIESLKVKPAEPEVEFVPKFYRMNVAEEDLLISGERLRNGMKVLSCLDTDRVRTNEPMDDWELDRALRNNRWCTVTQLEGDGAGIRFVGVYDDGTKYVRKYGMMVAWYVKKNSIPTTPREQKMYELIKEAMKRVVELGPDVVDDLAMQTSEKISELP